MSIIVQDATVGQRGVVPIGTVERETGLTKDVLRAWERRYGFPRPSRDKHGQRQYPLEQLERLRLIRQLIDRGMRPAKLTSVSLTELSRLLRMPVGVMPAPSAQNADVGSVLEAIKHNDLPAVHRNLGMQVMRLGLQRFLVDFLAPLNEAVGNGWSRGEVTVSQEHLYSEQVQSLLRQTIESVPPGMSRPRILLTTLPGEEHQLGLLMAHAWLLAEGAQCISLGVKTPVGEVIRSAAAQQVDIVGLSFSEAVKCTEAVESLTVLRAALEPGIALWAGGRLWEDYDHRLHGIDMIPTLGEASAALARWRGLH